MAGTKKSEVKAKTDSGQQFFRAGDKTTFTQAHLREEFTNRATEKVDLLCRRSDNQQHP